MIATADAAQTAAAIRAIGAAILDLLDAADEMDAVIADAPEEHRLRARAQCGAIRGQVNLTQFGDIALGIALVHAARAAIAIAAIVGALNARDRPVVKEERARVSEEAAKKDDRAQTARRTVTDDNARIMLQRWYRD